MLLEFIKMWIKRHKTWKYHKRVTIDSEYMNILFLHVKTAGYLQVYLQDKRTDNSRYDSAAHFLLGHYVLSSAAELSKYAYVKIVTSAPLNIQNDNEGLLTWVGRKVLLDNQTAVTNPDFLRLALLNDFDIHVPEGTVIPSGTQNTMTVSTDSKFYILTLNTLICKQLETILTSIKKGELTNSRDDLRRIYYLTALLNVMQMTFTDIYILKLIKDINANLVLITGPRV